MPVRLLHCLACVLACNLVLAEPPADLNPRLAFESDGIRLSLVAEHPMVVTPTGIDVDREGRIWVVVSHTHFRPEDYDGPEHDEVVVLTPDDQGGFTRSVFYAGTDATMDLELGPDGWVYLAERDRIVRVRDRDGDQVGDQLEQLAVLETEADYPHNGLSGLAFHPSGDLIFALGENFWKRWTLSSPEGTALQGTGEGGVFRCSPDGGSLRRVAHGFWNPFGICVREDGTIFAAENDPGARPPCRLLHVVEGGDYGYQRLYGNEPYHPFVCWNGELRGTLPMLAAVGEAPCGIAPLGNGLIVPSWTEHRIDFYPLTSEGASYRTSRRTLVRGGDHFRPTCITQVSPNEFYLTDWVYGSYEIHGRGRVWKLEVDPRQAAWLTMDPPAVTSQQVLAGELIAGGEATSREELFSLARSDDAFLRHAALVALAKRASQFHVSDVAEMPEQDLLSLLLALRRSDVQREAWVTFFWNRPEASLQFETLRWIADESLKQFRPLVEKRSRRSDISFALFEASLATLNILDGQPQDGIADSDRLLERVRDPQSSSLVRAYALRLLNPNDKRFDEPLWQVLYETADSSLIAELARALAGKGTAAANDMLLNIASDETLDAATRGDAIAGLSAAAEGVRSRLLSLADSKSRTLREEALRGLRFATLDQEALKTLAAIAERYPESADLVFAAIDPESVKSGRPKASDIDAWKQRLDAIDGTADLAAGRRIFHHAQVGTCAKCHRHRGRGAVVGPDLSAASNQGDPTRLLSALLQPSQEIDPQYYPRMLITREGQIFTGILLRDGGGGREVYRDNQGREVVFRTEEIEQRKELSTSMMPEGLIDLMTDREIRDLLAFLDHADAES